MTIDCTVIGDNPIEVQWMHNSDRLDMSNHRLSIGQIKTDNGLKSQLSIANSDRQDSGVYRCTADNAYGRSEHLIYLAVQGESAIEYFSNFLFCKFVSIFINNYILMIACTIRKDFALYMYIYFSFDYRETRSSSRTRGNRDRFSIDTAIMEAGFRRK